MPSTAISAQGTIVQIATGTGGAKTITAMAAGNPTIFTSSAHGLSLGDVVAIASITGTVATSVNGLNWVVTHKTTNTFTIALDSTGLAYTSGGTATPVTYTAVANVKAISGLESGSASVIDVTNLSSTAKEKRAGLVDNGAFSIAVHVNDGDAGQAAMQARRLDGVATNMKVILPSGTTPTRSFSGVVKKFSTESIAVDGVVEGSIEIEVNGAITKS
jgi:hypothetical protein